MSDEHEYVLAIIRCVLLNKNLIRGQNKGVLISKKTLIVCSSNGNINPSEKGLVGLIFRD
jgi:hypothetical protein